MATRDQAARRRARMRANGDVGVVAVAEIGERDGWLCGICEDSARLVDPAHACPHPLSASVDHIQPVAAGGPHAAGNVQIAHLFCNVEKNTGTWHKPEYMRAMLTRRLDGTPIPEAVYRADRAELSRRVRGRPSPLPGRPLPVPGPQRAEYMIALKIAAGDLAADPRYGDPGTRLDRFVADFGEEAVRSSLARMKAQRERRLARENRLQPEP